MAVIAASQSLVERVLPDERIARAAALTGFAVLGSLLLWASAKINVPFWPVMMSMQTFAVLLLAAAYGARLALSTMLLYLVEGAIGLPVFQGTPQQGLGASYMLGPTGGFLLGFAVAAAIIGWLAERGFDRGPVRLFGAMLIGTVPVFLVGVVWLAWFAMLPSGGSGVGIAKAIAGGVAPFILGDVLKLALAACLVSAGARLVRR